MRGHWSFILFIVTFLCVAVDPPHGCDLLFNLRRIYSCMKTRWRLAEISKVLFTEFALRGRDRMNYFLNFFLLILKIINERVGSQGNVHFDFFLHFQTYVASLASPVELCETLFYTLNTLHLSLFNGMVVTDQLWHSS